MADDQELYDRAADRYPTVIYVDPEILADRLDVPTCDNGSKRPRELSPHRGQTPTNHSWKDWSTCESLPAQLSSAEGRSATRSKAGATGTTSAGSDTATHSPRDRSSLPELRLRNASGQESIGKDLPPRTDQTSVPAGSGPAGPTTTATAASASKAESSLSTESSTTCWSGRSPKDLSRTISAAQQSASKPSLTNKDQRILSRSPIERTCGAASMPSGPTAYGDTPITEPTPTGLPPADAAAAHARVCAAPVEPIELASRIFGPDPGLLLGRWDDVYFRADDAEGA